MPLAELQKLAVSSIPDKTSKPAKAWLDDARQYLAAAETAERAGHREETLVNYSKVLISYNNFVSHKGAAEARQEQRTQLVYSDFRSVSDCGNPFGLAWLASGGADECRRTTTT
jgi:hypothetical protein